MTENAALHTPLILLAASVLVGTVFRRMKISPVLGYLAAGVFIGPFGFKYISDLENTKVIADLGVVFLLFVIGLQLSLKKLLEMRSMMFGLGTLQTIITAGVIGLIAYFAKLRVEECIIIGGALSLSSTAVVLEVLNERREEASQTGRISIAVLIMQDLLVVPMLVLLPTLSGLSEESTWRVAAIAIGKGLLALVVIFAVGWLILRPLYKIVASLHSMELFSAFTLLIVLGSAYLTNHLGLSMALGAFVAGLLIAETEYQHQVNTEIAPFKGLLLGLFFMTVGMSIDIDFIFSNLKELLALTGLLIFLKAGVIFSLCWVLRFKLSASFNAALILAQGGEFAFVLFKLANDLRILQLQTTQMLFVMVTLSMAVTPLLAMLGARGAMRLRKHNKQYIQNVQPEIYDMDSHVAIIGFGRVGQTLASFLAAEKITFIALDLEPRTVIDARKRRIPVYYGDARRQEILESLSLDRAQCAVISISDDKIAAAVAAQISAKYPDLLLIARAQDEFRAVKIRDAGAGIVVPETLESSLQLGAYVLENLHFPDYEISRIVHEFRKGNYELIHKAAIS